MVNNTFDIPAYKFAIVKFDNGYNFNSSEEMINFFRQDDGKKYHLIPFENVDGLTLEELKDIGFNEKILFVCYISYDYVLQGRSFQKKYYNYILQLIPFKLNAGERIDEALNNLLVSNYAFADKDSAKITLCFLERYCYKKQNDVFKRVREYKENNK